MMPRLRRWRFLTFAVIFFVSYAICLIVSKNGFPYDAGDYWERGKQLINPNLISDGFRGYIFPLFLGICDFIGGAGFWRIANSFLISVCFVFFVPELFDIKDKCSGMVNIKMMAVYGFFVFFFFGLLAYPLSDFPAMSVCILACCLKNRIFYEQKTLKCGMIFLLSLLLGACLYWMYNIRTIYLFSAVYLVFSIVYNFYKSGGAIKTKLLSVSGLLAGFLLSSLPQAYGNWQRTGKASFAVQTENLMSRQLYWGLLYQRYDTYIGTQVEFPQIYFIDDVGTRILDIEGLSANSPSLRQYVLLCLKYPFEIIGIYIRHIINILTPLWPDIYVTDLERNIFIISISAFTCFFLFVYIYICDGFQNRKLFCRFIPLLIPVLFIIPGAVEVRYFAALYLMVIGMLCFNTDWRKVMAFIKKKCGENADILYDVFWHDDVMLDFDVSELFLFGSASNLV